MAKQQQQQGKKNKSNNQWNEPTRLFFPSCPFADGCWWIRPRWAYAMWRPFSSLLLLSSFTNFAIHFATTLYSLEILATARASRITVHIFLAHCPATTGLVAWHAYKFSMGGHWAMDCIRTRWGLWGSVHGRVIDGLAPWWRPLFSFSHGFYKLVFFIFFFLSFLFFLLLCCCSLVFFLVGWFHFCLPEEEKRREETTRRREDKREETRRESKNNNKKKREYGHCCLTGLVRWLLLYVELLLSSFQGRERAFKTNWLPRCCSMLLGTYWNDDATAAAAAATTAARNLPAEECLINSSLLFIVFLLFLFF